ncbi:MAG TPA: hypothetical protein VMU26_01270 [Candidatus Polarisedimenticolia bacterium]|nr:hypothetical protein [Candidatus Polarisedimenticolia bacterium]
MAPKTLPVVLKPNPQTITEGGLVTLTAEYTGPSTIDPNSVTFQWNVASGQLVEPPASQNIATVHWDTTGLRVGSYSATVTVSATTNGGTVPYGGTDSESIVVNLRPIASGDTLPVAMQRTSEPPTSDTALWVAIRFSANQLSFQNYLQFVDTIMCSSPVNGNGGDSIDNIIETYLNPNGNATCLPPLGKRRFLPFPNMDAYRVLKVATECFLMLNCGVYLSQGALSSLVSNQPIAPPAPFPAASYDVNDDASRLNQSPTSLPSNITKWWSAYLASGNQYLNQETDQVALNRIIPYLALVRSRLSELPVNGFCDMGFQCYGILQRKLTHPCLTELIWSYWQEEGMLVQTLNAISRRFQNLRGFADRDPLMRFDLDPLRRLNSLLWGYVQDEQHRLSVVRRAYEYNHEYGLALEGKALRSMRPSDSRSKFLEAFHNLLYLCTIFFKEDDDTTVVADGFPVLNALKEVHYILAAGAANQFGELPSTARQEMLMQQWLLARPEMREFLGGKIMVPYPEEWMDRVDTVKSMQGWTDVSVIYFRDLAVYGEQIVLSVRYGAWSITNNPAQAANWARYWRPEIQAYIHAYRAATGVDLTSEPVNSTLPSVLLLRRLATQRPAVRG